MNKIINFIKNNQLLRNYFVKIFQISSSKIIYDTYSKVWKFNDRIKAFDYVKGSVFKSNMEGFPGYRNNLAFNDLFFFEFQRVEINSFTGLISIDNRYYFWDCGIRSIDALVSFPLHRKSISSKVFVSVERNFYHFIVDELPIIIFLTERAYEFTVYMSFYPRWKIELLNIFCPNLELRFLEKHSVLHVDYLYAIVKDASGYIHPRIIDFLRHKFLHLPYSPKSKKYSRIYISRSKAPSRRISNDEKLVQLLESFSFKSICFEDHTISEQISLFNEADFIVAPHGAGLANIFGANANSTLVELVDTNHFSYCYTFIADYLGLSYYQFKLDNKSGETLIDLSNFRVFIQSILKQS